MSEHIKDLYEAADAVLAQMRSDEHEQLFIDFIERIRTELRKSDEPGQLAQKDQVETVLGTWVELRGPGDIGPWTLPPMVRSS